METILCRKLSTPTMHLVQRSWLQKTQLDNYSNRCKLKKGWNINKLSYVSVELIHLVRGKGGVLVSGGYPEA